jgi:hypothetical protein
MRFQNALHIVFTMSGGGTLRQALRSKGFGGRVVVMPDFLGYGPIDAPAAERCEWLNREIGAMHEWPEEYDLLPAECERFWQESSGPGERVVWFSRRTLGEYTGFMEWVWRRPGEQYDVVDLTDVSVSPTIDGKPRLLVSLASTNPDRIDLEALLGRAAPLPERIRDLYLTSWRTLRAENAALRFVDASGLHSVPITHFDDVLMSYATPHWTKVSQVVGAALAYGFPDDYFEVDDRFLSARVRALVAAGRLEGEGDLFRIGSSKVRLPSAR